MHAIKFDELPDQIKRLFEARKKECACFVRFLNADKKPFQESYYVDPDNQRSVFIYKQATAWTHIRTFNLPS